jgi:NAD(P)-dependent dehydrogenase (short-subunit alcohol dehydrogenase family)
VNNVHSGVGDIAETVQDRFWEIEPEYWDRMNQVGLRSHYVSSVHAARMMTRRRAGLIVNVSSFGSISYLFNIAYGVGKAALDRMTADMAVELKSEGVAVISLWPGFVRTELTASLMKEATPGYRRVLDAYSETPMVAGRAVAALAADPGTMRKTGKVVIAAEIARRYGLREENGRRPWSPRSFRTFFRALLPGRWQRLAVLVPPGNVPLWLVAPMLVRFSEILKEKGGFRGAGGEAG